MLPYILYELSLFEPGADKQLAREDLLWMIEALTKRDQAYLRDHPDTPLLYKSGVVYEQPAQFQGDCEEVVALKKALGANARQPEVSKVLDRIQMVFAGERFRDIGVILKRGSADCDGLASWRAAELRQAKIEASPFITWRQRADGGYTYHVLVRYPDNTLEDPSLLLGMGGPDRVTDRQEQINWNQERVDKVLASAGKGKNGALTERDQLEAMLKGVIS